MTMENFTFGLVFGGVTGIIASVVLVIVIVAFMTMSKEEEEKKKCNYLIHYICINATTNEPLEDTATVIGAKSEEESIDMLRTYLKTCGNHSNSEPIEWIIEGQPQVFNFNDNNVICTRYYG